MTVPRGGTGARDTVVVGAGPAGLACALNPSRAGRRVVLPETPVVERRAR
ncbi:FAD-binding protein [Streptomyces sp. ME19-01-6]